MAALAALAALVVTAALVQAVRACRTRAARPLFEWWVVHEEENADEFYIGGQWRDTVEKRGDYKMAGWVIPVNGRINMSAGSVYRWILQVERMNRDRPEVQFGFQGAKFEHPWRLVTTTRCSRSRDEEPWTARPEGNRQIQENDLVHLELDMRRDPGRFWMAVNEEPFELVFDDVPTSRGVMPAVMLGGHGCTVRVRPATRCVPSPQSGRSRTYP